MRLKADGEFCVTRDEAKDTPLWQLFFSILYLFDSIFPGIVLIDKLHNLKKEFVSLTMVTLEKEKKTFHLYKRLLQAKNISSKTWNL